jgi:tryptophan-rich sensory protein
MRENFFKFLGFWLLQGISVFAIMICSLLFLNSSVTAFNPIGILIWGLGLLIESIADYQKFTFSNNTKNKGMWIATGLWKYSRHPNYLGEILCWVGIYVYAYPALSTINRLIALVSPLFITTLLLFISGIPILERKANEKWGKDKKYIEYKKNTSVLIPYQGLILSVVVCLSAGFISSFFTISSIGSWYSTINKPFFNPPSWIFGPVWTFLYILMGISVYIAVKKGANKKAIFIFALQLALNTLWSILFFGLRNPLFAFVEIVMLWIVILINIKVFQKYSRTSAYLLIPYILWVSFASMLNLYIVILN